MKHRRIVGGLYRSSVISLGRTPVQHRLPERATDVLKSHKGDILLVKRSFDNLRESEALMAAGRSLNLGFDVPIVFVSGNLNRYKVQHADLQENSADARLGSDEAK